MACLHLGITFVIVIVFRIFMVDSQHCERLVSLPAAQVVLKYDYDQSVDGPIELVNPNNKLIFQVTCIGTTCFSAQYLNSSLASTGNIATGKFHIQLDSFGDGQQGSYILRTAGRMELKCITLYMLGKPRPSSISANRVPHEGETVTLTCKSTSTTDPTGHGLVMSYNWTRDGTLLTTGGRFTLLPNTAASLTINNVQRNDEQSQYRCTATEEMGQTSDSSAAFNITVYYGPGTVSLSPSTHIYTKTEGDSMEDISCTSTCNPNCTYTWSKVGTSGTVKNNAVLNLGRLMRQQAGVYICTATNPSSSAKLNGSTVEIKVKYAPDVSIVQSASYLTEGLPLTLTCSANGYPSHYTYTGFKQTVGTTTIPNDNTEETGVRDDISVRIASLALQDSGLYTCTVHNNISDIDGNFMQSSSIRIDIKVKPQIFLVENRFAGPTRGRVNISIPIYSNPMYNKYGFQRQDGFPIIEDDKYEFQEMNSSIVTEFYGKPVTLHGRVLQITIQNLTEIDFGLYTFWITNEIGNTSAAVNVSARSIPSLPTQLNVTVIDNMPIFEWQKGFNGGFVQTFLLQTSSTMGEQLWTNRTSLLETDTIHLSDTGLFRVNITGLKVGHFNARLIAYNELGNADPVKFQPFEIIKYSDKETTIPSNWAIIGAAAGGSLGGLFVLGGVIFVLIRRRPFSKGKSKEDRAALRKDHALKDIAEDDGDDDIPDEVENPMYVIAGESANVYSNPVKKTTAQDAKANPGDIYAVVDKPKGKKKKGKTATYTSGQTEKVDDSQKTYENAGVVSTEPFQGGKKNADGMIYADLMLANPPKGKKRLVIHGIDEMTEYADVDLTKKAEPLPDSDEEK